ncbi:MAG: hypothetical protein IJ609_00890, partial [Paludibacteraceae bacterium]|nr:hypothetical protein [Paludibacteraceae bacterium]
NHARKLPDCTGSGAERGAVDEDASAGALAGAVCDRDDKPASQVGKAAWGAVPDSIWRNRRKRERERGKERESEKDLRVCDFFSTFAEIVEEEGEDTRHKIMRYEI